tara:strand:- start:244 stop:495 length:252 start_codon:yes stop_codon:yes gene_type:complete
MELKMTDERLAELIEATHKTWGDVFSLSKTKIEGWYMSNYGCGAIVSIDIYESGRIEVEFEDGWVHTEEPNHACYEHRRRRRW